MTLESNPTFRVRLVDKNNPSPEDFLRLVKHVVQLAEEDGDPLVIASARRLLHRVQMLSMDTVLAKVPGETWVDKAKIIGVTRMTLYGWRAGRCRPYPEQAERLEELTGFSAKAIRGTRNR